MDDPKIVTDILDKQIHQLQEEIQQNKINIAETFVRVESSMNNGELIPKDLSAVFKDMSNLRMLTSQLKENEAKLQVLITSKTEVTKFNLEELIKA